MFGNNEGLTPQSLKNSRNTVVVVILLVAVILLYFRREAFNLSVHPNINPGTKILPKNDVSENENENEIFTDEKKIKTSNNPDIQGLCIYVSAYDGYNYFYKAFFYLYEKYFLPYLNVPLFFVNNKQFINFTHVNFHQILVEGSFLSRLNNSLHKIKKISNCQYVYFMQEDHFILKPISLLGFIDSYFIIRNFSAQILKLGRNGMGPHTKFFRGKLNVVKKKALVGIGSKSKSVYYWYGPWINYNIHIISHNARIFELDFFIQNVEEALNYKNYTFAKPGSSLAHEYHGYQPWVYHPLIKWTTNDDKSLGVIICNVNHIFYKHGSRLKKKRRLGRLKGHGYCNEVNVTIVSSDYEFEMNKGILNFPCNENV